MKKRLRRYCRSISLKIFGTVDRIKYPVRGQSGGDAGLTGRFIHSVGIEFEGKGFCELKPGESLEVQTPGGGGWEEVVERSSEAIFKEQRR